MLNNWENDIYNAQQILNIRCWTFDSFVVALLITVIEKEEKFP